MLVEWMLSHTPGLIKGIAYLKVYHSPVKNENRKTTVYFLDEASKTLALLPAEPYTKKNIADIYCGRVCIGYFNIRYTFRSSHLTIHCNVIIPISLQLSTF